MHIMVNFLISAKNISIDTFDDGIFTTGPQAQSSAALDEKPDINVKEFDTLSITSENGFGIVNNGNGQGNSFLYKNTGSIYVIGNNNSNITIQGGYKNNDEKEAKAAVKNGYYGDLVSKQDYSTYISGGNITLTGVGYGIWTNKNQIKIEGTNNSINAILDDRFSDKYDLNAYNYFGIAIYNNSNSLTSPNSKTIITAKETNTIHGDKEGIKAETGSVSITGRNNEIFINYDETIVKEALKSDVANIDRYGINISGLSTVININATTGSNRISSIGEGIHATNGTVTMEAGIDNIIYAGNADYDYSNDYAIYSINKSNVSLNAKNSNVLRGAVYAQGADSEIVLQGYDEGSNSLKNELYSRKVIDDARDLRSKGETEDEKKDVISALYAEEGASITLNGNENIIRTKIDSSSSILERAVWAYNGEGSSSSININGYTDIATDSYEDSFIDNQTALNSKDVAVAAGTAVGLNYDTVAKKPTSVVDGRAAVNINYENNESGALSSITGDILSAYDGLVNIDTGDSGSGIRIRGNLLAGNNGVLNVDLGNGGTLIGRADDYGDAGLNGNNDGGEGHQSSEFFDPAFSSTIYQGGVIKLDMGADSTWEVTGQSWITEINTGYENTEPTSVAGVPTIDLLSANDDLNGDAAALTVYRFNGDAVFNMKLDGYDLSKGNMLYMKEANGTYYINLADAVSEAEINTLEHDGLRFATVGENSKVNFYVGTKDGGAFNVEYEVGTDNYDDTVDENQSYNGDSLTEKKPGDDSVGDFFADDKTPATAEVAAANQIMTLDAASADETAETAANEIKETKAVNHKIIAVKNREISDGGKTIINMSRANYANAVYMDTLNKRQGEARFVGDTDHGVWVRLRHDNIGKEDSFRSHNTMVEVGIDQRDVHDYGEFHTGVALDYMNGSLDYHTVDGDGDIERYGVWFYTTFLGNDGQYADLILKYGHLKNDFGFNTRSQGEHVTGAYTNETASLSAEYGWKFSNSHNYYIEPQAQLQYTYVTGADYTTSQGTKVDLDSIHSLIGRVGIRAGKDFLDWEHPVSIYARADALHEFLGDQDIYAYDDTGVMDVTYENDDTWYTVGLGLTVKSSENTYFFIEGETALGADNEDTYTFSGGFRHSF